MDKNKYLYKPITKEKFIEYLFEFEGFSRDITHITLHELWKKPKNKWWGYKSYKGLKKFYEDQGRSFAFHIAVKNDDIWICKDLNEEPCHSGIRNEGSIDVECDAVIGFREPSEKTWGTYLFVVNELMRKFSIEPNQLYCHYRFDENTDCPGFTEEFFLEELNRLT